MYESSGPFSFRQEDFWKLHFENLFLTPWPIYATNWNSLNNFGGTSRDHSCAVWSNSNKRFLKRSCLKKLLTDGCTHKRTMDNGQWAITKAHLEHFVLRWAKNKKVKIPHTAVLSNVIQCTCICVVVSLTQNLKYHVFPE